MTTAAETQAKNCTLQMIVSGIGWQPITDPETPMTRDECWARLDAVRGDYPEGTEFGVGVHTWERDGDRWKMMPR